MSTNASVRISDDELRHRHEQVPPDYYDVGVRRNIFQRIWHAKRLPVVQSFLSGQGGKILDIGCHGGFLTAVIAKVSGSEVTGIDISAEAVNYAQQHNPTMKFVVGDVQQRLPFEGAVFNAVTGFDVLEHIPKLEATLREIHRVLAPNGRLIVGVPRETHLFRMVWAVWTKLRGAVWDDVHVHHFDVAGLRRVAEAAGFVPVRQMISHWGMYLTMEFRRVS